MCVGVCVRIYLIFNEPNCQNQNLQADSSLTNSDCFFLLCEQSKNYNNDEDDGGGDSIDRMEIQIIILSILIKRHIR